ncbi:MAG: hypothetical protein KDC14_07410 [Planctomycetes bacterium]|nr:hypothetical protein [Planctomycetota bacterium]
MVRCLSLAALCVAFLLALAVPHVPAAASDVDCASKATRPAGEIFELICGSEGACGSGSLCLHALGRDALGDFYVCRCSGSGMTKCCQLILRAPYLIPEAVGSCAECGQVGNCSMNAAPTGHKAVCSDRDMERS